MQTLTITAADLTDGVYTGATDVSDFEGHIEIEANLGTVRFKAGICVAGGIFAKAGSGIEAGLGI